ncbi:MAG: dockerin type I repeat-containing protein [candidate division Zixibacteria bacterium]|nr:dockerin type I repeat-containing protein [candidate division Zixibacteria bacterium]
MPLDRVSTIKILVVGVILLVILLARMLEGRCKPNTPNDPVPCGSNCLDAEEILFPAYVSSLLIDGRSTCSALNDYSSTCLGYYDNGEDYVIRLEVTRTLACQITLDPKGTGWTGIVIDDNCPPDYDCLGLSTTSGTMPHSILGLLLQPGFYYIMVDTWPSPACIPEFDILITEISYDPFGVDCTLPLSLPPIAASSLPYVLGSITTVAAEDNYSATCLEEFDGGEDLFFDFELTEQLRLSFDLDPGGVAGSGFLLDTICPPTDKCIASATSGDTMPYGIAGITLPPSHYYLMIDTWSPSVLLNAATLTIDLAYLCGDADGSGNISISDAIYVVSYVFAGGAAPEPLAAADVDVSGVVNVSDAVYLINYIFAGGAAPCG